MNRTNIEQNDVFISWTGKDREIKNRIVDFLRQNGITCTESDHSCAGDFREWSREAVSKSTVFLLLYTENTPNSQYVPIEIEEFKKLDEYHNRCIPVVQSFELYEKYLPDLAEKESAVIFIKKENDNNTVSYELTDELLEKILFNVQSLINNRFYKIYREATRPAYLRIASMLKSMRVADKELDYKKLYVRRTVKDADNNAVSDASEFIRAKDIFFLQGPAGSGKSSYIDEIREAADDKTLVMSLSCRKLTGKPDLFSFMFDEFTRHCANRHFYTTNDFRSLLSVRHLNLILDGMDEIATDEGKRAFLNMVSDYYKANADTTTLFFTGRNIEDADLIAMNGQSPKILFLQSFEEDQIKVFGENLFMLLGSAEKNNEFYVRIKDLSDEIRTNPLLLSQLMIVYEKTDKIPETVVGIYEAVCEITLANENEVSDVPEEYKTMITKSLSGILKHFSAERYRLQSQGKDVASVKIFASILKNKYDDARERAAFLEDYLKNRAIMKSDDSFYHKMLLEYFTAVYYYEKCFDSYGSEIEDKDTLRELFSHNTDAYWSDVLKLFLIKADSEIDGDTTTVLYNTLLSFGITEYTLFFDAAKNLIFHKKEALTALISDILKKSAEGIYPPYGPLFWYVPEFNLYEEVIASLDALKESDCFTKALALARDVCRIFGHFNRISEISDKYDGTALFGKAQLSGVRKGLCELFFTGHTDTEDGQDIYPRCFNIKEAKSWLETGCGIYGRMKTPFEDELSLYSHESFTELSGEFIGIVSAKYDTEVIETTLGKKSCKKLSGLFLSPSEKKLMQKLAINDRHLKEMYIPETILDFERDYKRTNCIIIDNAILYFNDKLVIPDTAEKIENEAFKDFKKVRSIILYNKIKEIGEYAFSDCSSLEEIKLPDSITEIGERAFYCCTSLHSINIPENVTSIKEGTFFCCHKLKNVKLHNNITALEKGAFADCRSLSEIDLPDNLKTIAEYTFDNCHSLETIDIPDSIISINSGTFMNCSSLKSIILPKNLKIIEKYVFRNCSALSSIEIPEGTKTISESAFEKCEALESILLPDSIQVLGNNVFRVCINLQRIENCPKGYSNTYLGIYHKCNVLYREEELKTLIIPDGTTEIEDYKFAFDCSFDAIKFPESVKRIGYQAFKDCQALKSLILPDSITDISSGAFDGCKSLSFVKLSDKITYIDKFTFADCKALEKIVFPEKLRTINSRAFENCFSLSSVKFPDSIVSLGIDVFINCENLKKIENCPVGYTYEDLGVSSDCQIYYRTEDLQPLIIPDDITEISKIQFIGLKNINSILFTNSIIKIDDYAFADCCSVSTVCLPDSIKSLGELIFLGCKNLKTIENCPVGYTHADLGVASDCRILYRKEDLETIIIPEDITKIPDKSFKGYRNINKVKFHNNVTIIGNDAFMRCRSLVSIHLSSMITSIGHNAFEDCSSLSEISLPDSVIEIGRNAFENCTALKTVRLSEKIQFIGNGTFRNCSSLTSIVIPNEVTGIDMYAFCGCKALQEVIFSEKLLIIGSYSFENCTSLKTLDFPDSIKRIYSRAFSGCRSLVCVRLSENLYEIALSSFKNCNSLPKISIPNSVRKIGDGAFAGCTGLREISISRRFEEDLQRIFPDVDLSEVKINWI